ncbi:MAG: ABC-type branched-chain amino acid transport system, ATPase component [Acidimicrobiaceae bacterium]|nr:ABC-type branched-chain amino acid transport system, ATPase component [Acidimicrobiaceae bacterium]
MDHNTQALQVSDLCAGYGSAQVLFRISFNVEQGGVLAILGPNGAGKSTLGLALAGLIPATAGTIEFEGARLSGHSAHQVARAGITYIPEGRGIFPRLSVDDNLRMATRRLRKGERRAALQEAFENFPVLLNRKDQLARTLSGGEQQMLALANAFCTESKLIIADELSLGLAPMIVDQVFATLERAKSAGTTIIIIEQFVTRALALADNCLILAHGSVAWSGTASDASGAAARQYFGQGVEVVGRRSNSESESDVDENVGG